MYTEGSGLDCPKMKKENSGFRTRAPSKTMPPPPPPCPLYHLKNEFTAVWRIPYALLALKQGVQRRPSVRAVDFQVLFCIP